MAELKTKPNDDDVDAFIDSVPEPARSDCRELVALMQACLYIKRLDDVDRDVLDALIREAASGKDT